MSRDGRYGSGQRRQTFRCTDREGAFHRFTPLLPREHTDGGVCDTCDSALHPHTGPVVGRKYSHRLRLVAEALVAVGQGVSYAHASNRARAAAGRTPILGGSAGQLVAEWVDSWAPAVIDAHAETDWPEDPTDIGTVVAFRRAQQSTYLVDHGLLALR